MYKLFFSLLFLFLEDSNTSCSSKIVHPVLPSRAWNVVCDLLRKGRDTKSMEYDCTDYLV